MNMRIKQIKIDFQVCDRLQMPMWKTNPLFSRTVECCRRKKK